MSFKNLSLGTKIALGGVLACLVIGGLALGIDTPADAVLGEINAIAVPEVAPEAKNNPQVVQRVGMMRQAAVERRAALIGKLYGLDPDRPELATLLPERWQVVIGTEKYEEAGREIERTLNKSQDAKLKQEAGFFKVVGIFREASKAGNFEVMNGPIDEFIRTYPTDPRGGGMLDALAKNTRDPAAKAALLDRLIANYPETPPGKLAAIERKRLQGAGKPFEIDFVDVINGGRVNSAALKGKIVVVDFWATWCGPCIAALPQMKSLYAQYKDQGVEFVGVSLDLPPEQGGLDKLKEFVRTNGIEWPQYYEGKPSAQDFALDWGILTIPAVFLIDADGKVFSTEAGPNLDALIPELITRQKLRANP